MIQNPFVRERYRNKLILSELLQKHKGIELDRLLAIFSAKTGLSMKTCKQYYDEIKLLELEEEIST